MEYLGDPKTGLTFAMGPADEADELTKKASNTTHLIPFPPISAPPTLPRLGGGRETGVVVGSESQ